MPLIGNPLVSTGSARDGISMVRVFFVVTLAAAAIIEVGAAFAADTVEKGLQFLALNLILGGAAGLVGGLIGFISGIPRALTDEATPATAGNLNLPQNNRRSKTNTNLEQIFDWLTKILVGASLVSLATIPGFMAKIVNYFDAGAYRDLPGGGTLALFIGIYFLALGFYWSYIETRTSLTFIFDTYQADVSEDILLKVRSAPWEPGSPPIPEDVTVRKLDVASLTTPALLEARAAAETRAGNYREAANLYRRDLELDPGNPRLQTRLSVVLAAGGNAAAAENLVQTLQTATAGNAPQRNQLEAYRVLNALYKPAPDGFQEAISIGEPLLQTEQASNGQLHLWLACAYGQKLGYQRSSPIPPDDSDRQKALVRLKDMARLRPDLLPLARSLWRPDPGSNENDLAIFRDDPEFEAVLKAG